MKEHYKFPRASGTLRLLGRPRPSSTAERNFEREDDVEIEEGDKKGSTRERFVVHDWRIFSRHREEPHVKLYDPDNEKFPTLGLRRRDETCRPMTKITSRWLLTLVWNWKKILLLLCRALWGMTVEVKPQDFLQLLQSTGQSDSENKGACGKWSENTRVTVPKRGRWEVLTVALFRNLLPEAKAAVDKEWETSKKLPRSRVTRPKSPVKRRKMEKQFTSRIWWISVTWRTPNVRNTSFSYQWRVMLQGQRQGRRRIQSSIHRTRRTSFTDGSGKIVGHYLEASWYGWRSKWRSFSVHSGQDYQSSLTVTIARRRMSRDMDQGCLHDKTRKVGIILTILWYLWKKLFRPPISQPSVWKKSWGNALWKEMGIPTWRCLHAHKKLGLFLSDDFHDFKMVGQKKKDMGPMWRNLQKEIDLEDPTPLIDQVYVGCTQDKQRLISKHFSPKLLKNSDKGGWW